MNPFTFRLVQASQVEHLQQIAESTFRATYQHLNDPLHFENYVNKAFSLENLRQEIAAPNTAYYFALQENNIQGYFKLNFQKGAGSLKNEEATELERIYLDKSLQGQGLGGQLIQKAKQLSKEHDAQWLWLGVWQQNKKALHFYKKHGFEIYGEHNFMMGDDPQSDYLMRIGL